MRSITELAASFSPATLVAYAKFRKWTHPEGAFKDLKGPELGQKVKALHADLPVKLQDRIFQDFELVERLAKDKSRSAIRDAIAGHPEIISSIELMKNDCDRALWLLTQHYKTFFQKAMHALLYASLAGGQRKWRGYLLTEFSRDWSPDGRTPGKIEQLVRRVVKGIEGVRRKVKVETWERPSSADVPQPLSFQFSISVSDRSSDWEEWVGDDLDTHEGVPNRRFELVVSPSAKTIECVSAVEDGKLLEALTREFAIKILQQSDNLEAFKPRKYDLRILKTRPKQWDLHDEDGIKSVKVTKLVVMAGKGTATYWVSARSEGDAYDAAAAAVGRSADHAIGRRPIVAAGFRVEFAEGVSGRRGRFVPFEITLPNKCDLREKRERDRMLLETYLPLWKLVKLDDPPPN